MSKAITSMKPVSIEIEGNYRSYSNTKTKALLFAQKENWERSMEADIIRVYFDTVGFIFDVVIHLSKLGTFVDMMWFIHT